VKIAGELVRLAKSLVSAEEIPGFTSHVEKTYPLAFRMLRDMRQDVTAVGLNRVIRELKDKIRKKEYPLFEDISLMIRSNGGRKVTPYDMDQMETKELSDLVEGAKYKRMFNTLHNDAWIEDEEERNFPKWKKGILVRIDELDGLKAVEEQLLSVISDWKKNRKRYM